MTDLLHLAERVRRRATGETFVVDLRGADDLLDAATSAIAQLRGAGRDVDEFVLDASQEVDLGIRLGSLQMLLGYPAHVVYEIADEEPSWPRSAAMRSSSVRPFGTRIGTKAADTAEFDPRGQDRGVS